MADPAAAPRASQQRFVVVVREAEDTETLGRLSPATSPHESTRRLLQTGANENNNSNSPHESGMFMSEGSEDVDEVDVDSVAQEIGVSAEALLRYLQENPQTERNDPRRLETMMQCHAMVTKLGGHQPSRHQPNQSPDVSTDDSSSNTRSTVPQLVALEFAPGENGGVVGGVDEMTPSTVADGPTPEQHPSQLVFKCSGSNFSQSSQRHLSDMSTPGRGPDGRRGIHFANNVVTDVIVYEVDQELYVGIEYARHWIGWVSLFLGLVFEIVFDVHIGWFVYIERPAAGYLAVQNWICVLRALLSALYMVACMLLGIGVAPSLQYSFSCKGFTLTTLMSLALSGALALEVVTSKLADTPHFFTTSILHCAWIVGFRVFMKQMVFFAEVIGVAVAIVGFVITNISVDSEISFYTDAVGNVVMLISSLLYAGYFLLQEYLRARSPSAPMVFNIGMMAPIIGFTLAASYGTAINASSEGMYGMFASPNIVHASLLAVEGLIVNVLFLAALMYLDLLSVSSCYALKSVFAPLFMHYLVWDAHPSLQPPIDKKQWDVWYFVGLGIVIVGSATVIYFASIKRKYVARRIAQGSRRSAPNPYRKRRNSAAAAAANSAGTGTPGSPNVPIPPASFVRPSSPSRRSSVDSRVGGKRIVLASQTANSTP